MSNLTLGPVIGRIGGGGVEVSEIPVNFVSSSAYGDLGVQHVVDVPIPEGVTARVIVVGITEATDTGSAFIPSLRIGGVTVGYPLQAFAGERVVTGPTVVEANRRYSGSSGDPSFVGTVYWWEEVVGDE